MLRVYSALVARQAGVNTWAWSALEDMSERRFNPVPWKRLWRWLEKWDRKGWWNYGVSLRSGGFTAEGLARVSEVLSERLGCPCRASRDAGWGL